ncbi:MAG: hypothetical protein LQ352_004508 [Teloschistes flavicans]|nr:MAG: hypothetical protein LQ352_004508 [Teloschistes flavicans]
MEGAFYQNRNQLTESTDDYYAAPLRRVFYVLKKQMVLQYVTTLVLDELTAPAALVKEILCDEPYNVRILSLRGVKNLGDEKLIQILRYLIRPSRPADTPKLKGLYYFTPANRPSSSLSNPGTQHLPLRQAEGVTTVAGSHLGYRAPSTRTLPIGATWTNGEGNLFHPNHETNETWAQLIEACQGIIAFDTVVCSHGLRSSLPPRLASIALNANGCQKCQSAPEQALTYGKTPRHQLPLLSPPPLFSSTVKAAQCLAPGEQPSFYARCAQCMKDRRCESCTVWWCEDCYATPEKRFQANKTGMEPEIKVHMGFCVSKCLIEELYTGLGEGGMWG